MAQSRYQNQDRSDFNAPIAIGNTLHAKKAMIVPSKVLAKNNLIVTNIWFLRSILLVAGIITATLLFAYDFIFIGTYFTLGDTTSYFPWTWGILYTNYGAVQSLFMEVAAISIIAIVFCGFMLAFVLLELKDAIFT
jgi:hypothetical protein